MHRTAFEPPKGDGRHADDGEVSIRTTRAHGRESSKGGVP